MMYFPEPEVLLSPISKHPETFEPRAALYYEGAGFGTIQRFSDENDEPYYLINMDDLNVTLNGLDIVPKVNEQLTLPDTDSIRDIGSEFKRIAGYTISRYFSNQVAERMRYPALRR